MSKQRYNLPGNSDSGKPNYKDIYKALLHRLEVHTQTFKDLKASQTSLSKFIWDLKRKNINYNITWKILDRGGTFSPLSGKCGLCIGEKFHILLRPESATINSRDEVFSACRHKRPKLLIKEKRKSPG